MEKTIFQILSVETVVYGTAEADTIISFSGAGLRWWFLVDDGKYSLADTLHHNSDLSKAPVAYARQLASDWFDWTMNHFAGGSSDSDTGTMVTTVYEGGAAVSSAAPPISEKQFPIVEPPYEDAHKKDAHTEHCCVTHRKCRYGSKKCTVVSGEKNPSYPCSC